MIRKIVLLLLFIIFPLFPKKYDAVSVVASWLISFYKEVLSPLQGRNVCNFYPSCSTFAKMAYEQYGFFYGTLMTFDRLQRCHPGAWKYLYLYYPEIKNNRIYDPPENHYIPHRVGKKK